MSSTNKTTNLELSQFIGSDSPKWLTDYNADMEKIDDSYQTVKAQADATDLIVGGHTSSLSSLQSTVTEQGTAISGLRTDVTANSGSINTINSLIGNGEPTTTDKTIIGAINELAAEMPSPTTQLPATSVSYSNTSSGLTATNVQAAIDEVKTDIPSSAADVSYSNTTSGLSANTVQAAIDEVKAEVDAIPTSSILTGTIKGTTSANGNLSTNLGSNIAILAAHANTSIMVTPYFDGNTWNFHLIQTGATTYNVHASQSVTVTYYYVELS